MAPKQYFSNLWNGGLDPATADSVELRQRRIVSTTIFLLMPVAITLIVANTLVFGAAEENYPIIFVLTLVTLGIHLQATFGWFRFAASTVIASFWIAPSLLIFQGGFNTSNWAWLLPIALLGHLLGDTTLAVAWAAIGLFTLWLFSALTLLGYMDVAVNAANHASAIAISGTLLFMMIFLAGYSFRTNHNRIGKQLKDNLQKLAAEVEVRRKAEEAALAGEKSKAVFLTTVSHELRTPLNGVIGASQLLNSSDLNDEQRELMEIISESGDILLELINNVLDLSRLDSGKLELENEPLSIDTLLSASIAPLLLPARQKGVELEYEITPDVSKFVLGDVGRLRQIILNLAGNALKFTETGSVNIRIENTEDGLLFRFKDSGIGFTEETKRKLFQPFEQADSSTSRRFGGSGLGLSIVAELVSSMGGKIEVESQPDVGSVFDVYLPLQACAAPSITVATAHTVSKDDQLQALNILVTDDNRVNRIVASNMLRKLGHSVVEAADGFEAINAVASQEIDLVLMDVQMPNMDGVAATSHIRTMKNPKRSIPIVGLTANAMPKDRQKLLDAGMDYYLPKPVRLDQLQEALEELCSGLARSPCQ